MIGLLQSLLIPANPQLCKIFDMKGAESDTLYDNTCDLFLSGDNVTSLVCASLLAESYNLNSIKESIEEKVEEMSVLESLKMNKHRLSFGPVRFNSSKVLFSKLILGQSVPKRSYSY